MSDEQGKWMKMRARAWRTVGIATAVLAIGASALPAQADETTATVSGVALSVDGDVVADARVSVSPAEGGQVYSGDVAEDGTFEIADIPPGDYYVQAADSRDQLEAVYQGGYWDGEPGGSDAVTLPAGVTDVTFELDYLRGVIGEALDEAGNPLEDVVLRIEILNEETGVWQNWGRDAPITNEEGLAFGVMDPGTTYRACMVDANYSRENQPEFRYGTSCWATGTDIEDATPLTLTQDDRKIAISMTMSIEGRSIWHEYPIVYGAGTAESPFTAEENRWTPAQVQLEYQWSSLADEPGAETVEIPGATERTFVPPAELEGAYVYVTITGSAEGYVTTSTTTSAGVAGVLRTGVASFGLAGEATTGTVVSAEIGETTPSDANTELTWYSDGVLIEGEWGQTLAITDELAGTAISARLRAYDFSFGEESEYEERIAFASIPGTVTPGTATITGDATIGGSLRADAGDWAPGHLGYSYQWLRDGDEIAGASGATYSPVAADDGALLTVEVTGSAYLYGPVTVESDGGVFAGAAIMAGSPVIVSPMLPQLKDPLFVTAGEWGPQGVTLSYQWYRGDTPIPGATRPSYVVRQDDVGSGIFVEVTGSAPGIEPVSVMSPGTRTVGLGGVIGPQPPSN